MIASIVEFIAAVQDDLAKWVGIKPWFRGESGDQPPLCPKISQYAPEQEIYLLQSFRRKSGGLANTPNRQHTDMDTAGVIWFDEWTKAADIPPVSFMVETSPGKRRRAYGHHGSSW